MLMLGSCLEIETPQAPETTGDPLYDLLPPQVQHIMVTMTTLSIHCYRSTSLHSWCLLSS